jgi:hypothetical protein
VSSRCPAKSTETNTRPDSREFADQEVVAGDTAGHPSAAVEVHRAAKPDLTVSNLIAVSYMTRV